MASHQGVLTLALTVVLLALPSLTCGVTLHVRPTSTNTSCPTHPCQTLSEYAQDPGQYFKDSNLTVTFLQGTHTLDINLTITNINQLEIHGALLPTKVVCDSLVGFTFSNIYRVSIDGLAFVACARSSVVQFSSTFYPEKIGPAKTYYGLHLQSVLMAEIIGCTFQDSYGSALGVVDSGVVLRGNNFLNNCRLCSNRRCSVYNYQGPRCFGGGVFVQRSNLSVTGSSSFSDNSACYGGGVSAWGSSNMNISGNTIFSGNLAWWYGGGVSAGSSNVNISGNTTFSGNSAWHGGGVNAWSSSNVNISGNTTFSNNSARYGGGVSADGSHVNISGNTTFSGNSASDGGAVRVLYGNVYISGNAMFRSNSARIGGCVLVYSHTSTASLNLDGKCSFTNCSATSDGGAIHASDIILNLSGTNIFNANAAEHFGGGLYSHKSSLTIDGDNWEGFDCSKCNRKSMC